MPSDYLVVAVFLIVGIVFVAVTLGFAWLLREKPKYISPAKLAPYECGEHPIGQAWSQYYVRYYIFALIFVIFDVEVVFLFPWALVLKELGLFAFAEMVVFLAILLAGLYYAWRKGILKWT
ncbi:MAG: NADH-quinone oxidoreductase subunit A [Armatimonadota bacterium]